MLELKKVSMKTENGTDILKDIDLVLQNKKIYAVTGPNGSGKSSLAKIIMGIVTPSAGKILLDGEDITQMSVSQRARLGIGYAFQQPPRFKGIKVRELLSLSSADNSKSTQVCDLLFQVGLCSRDYLDREIDATLSGGELKRIEIATVLARDLKLAVFDEPEAGIDLWSFQKLAETFRVMHEQHNTTIVIISHQERILELADEIILMSGGSIRENVPKKEILTGSIEDVGCLCRPKCGRKGTDDVECVR